MKLDLPYLLSDPDRHGKPRLYVRRHGRKVRMREKPGSAEFLAAYSAALEQLDEPLAPKARARLTAAPRGSLGWLGAQYFGSEEFKSLDVVSQRTRRLVLEACFREPRKPASPDLMAACPISVLSSAHVQMLRDRKAAKRVRRTTGSSTCRQCSAGRSRRTTCG